MSSEVGVTILVKSKKAAFLICIVSQVGEYSLSDFDPIK